MVLQALLDRRELLGQLVLQAILDQLDQPAPRELKVCQGLLVLRAHRGLLVLQGQLAHKAILVLQGRPGHRELLGQQALPGRKV